MVAAQRQAPPARESGRSSLLMPSGSLQQFETLLGHPGWFRHGTALAPWPAPMPDVIAMADDLMILGNIASHGRCAPILASLMAPGGPPHTPGMAATLALAPTVADALDLLLREIPRRNPFIRLDRSDAERELASRGFQRVGGYDRPEGGHSYTWWNGGTRQCISLNARRGQVEAIEDVYEGNCQ